MAEVSTRVSLATAFDAQAGYLVLEQDSERGPGYFRCYASGEVRFAASAGAVSRHGTARQELAEEIPFTGREAQASHPVGKHRFHWLGRDGGALRVSPSGALQRSVDNGPAVLRLQYESPYIVCHIDLPHTVLVVATMGDAEASLVLAPPDEQYDADWQGDGFEDDPWDIDNQPRQTIRLRLVNCYTGDDINIPEGVTARLSLGSHTATARGDNFADLPGVSNGTYSVRASGVPGYIDTDQDSLANDSVTIKSDG